MNYRTLAEATTLYFTLHPEEINDFLTELFADYAEDGDSAVLHSALSIVAQVKGVSEIAAQIGMSRQGL